MPSPYDQHGQPDAEPSRNVFVRYQKEFERRFNQFRQGYGTLLEQVIAHRRAFVTISLTIVVGSLSLFFFLGRVQGQRILVRFPHARERAHRFDAMLSRWHAPLIVCIRFMYGFRIIGPVLLGMGRVPAWKFLVYNFIGAAIWAPLIAGLGYLFGGILEALLHDMKRYEIWGFLAIIAIGLIGMLLRRR